MNGLTKLWKTVTAEAEQQRSELKRRNDELEGLSEISKTFENLDDVAAAFRLLTERIARLLEAQICMLARYDPKAERLYGMPPGFGLTDQQIEQFQYQIDSSIDAFWGPGQGDYLIIEDPAQLPPPLAAYACSLDVHQVLAVRMTWRGDRIGTIFLANRIDGRPFRVEDARLLNILASQAAVIVENARLYQEVQASLRDVTRLYAVSAQLAIRSSCAEISQRAVQTIAEALNAPSAIIARLNESTGLLEYAATLGVPAEALKAPFGANGVGMTVLRAGEPCFIEDVQTAGDISSVTRGWGYRALACLSLRHGSKGVGVLFVNYAEPHTFTPTERNMLAIFADQTAIALENAQHLSAEQRRSMELDVLANLSRSLAETMDLEEIFRVFEQQIRPKMPAADAGALLIYDPQSGSLIPRASFGYDREVLQMMALRPGESIVGRVFQTNQPMLVSGRDSVREGRRTMRLDNQALLAAASMWSIVPQSIICAPMRASGETLGVMVLDNSKSPEAFTQDDLEFLAAMADRIALAIRNAHLFAREQRRASQLAMVNDLGHRVTAILDMDELGQTLTHLIRDKFGYRYVHLFISDPVKREAVLRAGAGSAVGVLIADQLTLKFDQGIIGWTAAHGQTVIANDVSREPRFVFHPALAETHAEIAVPLAVGGRIIGVLDIQSEQINAFDPSDVTTLETLAGQVAIAIDNARLYGEMQEQARRDSLTQVYNHGYFLERLSEEIERARSESRPLSLIMLDVDYFKEYNDAYGHVRGDAVLSRIVQAIHAHVHQTDLVGRWGGEEFGIALLGTDTADTLYVAQRIRQTLEEMRIEKKDGSLIPPPTISQGLASFPAHAPDAATLIDLADAALYRAKARGRDQVCVAGQNE